MKDLLRKTIKAVFVSAVIGVCLIAVGCQTINGFGDDLDSWVITEDEVRIEQMKAYNAGREGISYDYVK